MTDEVFRIGIVGGIGPAVIVDFMRKVVRHAAVRRDGTYLGMLIEQSPQIADRAENLIGAGPDLTVAFHAACNNPEAAGADIIAIPCNMPRAFVQRVLPHLGVQIANMLDVTARHVADAFPIQPSVGLLATSGARRDDLCAALGDLLSQGVDIVILGCPHLAVVLPPTLATGNARMVTLIDPATVLAQHGVACAVAEQSRARRDAASHQTGAAHPEQAQGQATCRPEPCSTINLAATAESVPRASTSNRRASS